MRQADYELAELQVKFRDFYNQNLGSKFAELEEIRLKNLCFFWKWLVIFVFVTSGIVYLCMNGTIPAKIYDEDVFVYGIVFYVSAVLATLNLPFSNYKSDTKSMVMERIVSFFGDFRYSAHNQIERSVVEKSALFDSFSSKGSDDYFEGSYQGVKIRVSEERLVRVVHTRKGRREVTVFNGILILLDMNKKFSGQTVVRRDWGIFNFLMAAPRCFIKKENVKLGNVRLEDSAFEKQFEVFSSDQIEARYLLTTAFMERILEIKRRFRGRKIQFSFFDDKLLIAVSSSGDMFETTGLFTTTARYGKMREVVSQFYSIFSIIGVLKLNKKLGM